MRDAARSLGVVRQAYVDEALAAGSLSNLSLVIWRGEKTAERAASERRSLMALTAQHPGDTFALFVIKASTPPLNEAFSDLDEATRWLLAQGAQGSLHGVTDAVRALESAPLEESAPRAQRA